MIGGGYASLLNDQSVADGTAYASSTTLTDVSPAPQTQMLVMPSGHTMRIGSKLRVIAHGKFSNTGTPTLLIGLYWGGVAGIKLAAIGATTTITAATNWSFRLEATITCRGLGSGTSGSLYTTGELFMPASLTQYQAAYVLDAAAPAAVGVDTTTQKALTLGAQWSANSASNTLTVVEWLVRSEN